MFQTAYFPPTVHSFHGQSLILSNFCIITIWTLPDKCLNWAHLYTQYGGQHTIAAVSSFYKLLVSNFPKLLIHIESCRILYVLLVWILCKHWVIPQMAMLHVKYVPDMDANMNKFMNMTMYHTFVPLFCQPSLLSTKHFTSMYDRKYKRPQKSIPHIWAHYGKST